MRTRPAWVPVLLVGIIAGIDNIGTGLAIASLLFAGPLVPGLGLGVGVVLLGGAILALMVALCSSQPNSVALVQETTVAILAAATATMTVQLDAPTEVKIATALAILGVSTLVSGGLFWITGRLGFGRLVRFLPHPVVAGFLAGSGWLLVDGAMAMLTGEGIGTQFLAHLADPNILSRVLPAVLFAVVMLAALHRFPHVAIPPLVMIAAGIVFYVVLAVLDIDVMTAQAIGHLPDLSGSNVIALPGPALLVRIDWLPVLTAAPSILSVAALSMMGLLLNISGLELATSHDIDVNAELRSSGVANLLSGICGGPSGYIGLGVTLLAEKMGARGRGTGIATAAIMTLGLFMADPLISYVPVFLTAGFVLFLGVELLKDWLVASRRQLPLLEWLIVVLILAVVAVVGFMPGLVVGLLVSIAVFVFNYARLPVVRQSASGIDRRSSVDRSPAAMEYLLRHGDAIEVVQLQGYLFFGTADRIVDHVRRRLAAADRASLRFLVLDFRYVSGVDSAAATCFVKIRGLINTQRVKLFFSHVSPEVERALRRADIIFDDNLTTTLEVDIDHAVEQAEEMLLSEAPELDAGTHLVNHLVAAIGAYPRLADLVALMSCMSMQPEEVLIRAGDDADDVFFVAHGRVRVQITLPDGRVIRLQTITSGAIVGEIALYLRRKRTADVIVEIPSEIFRLSATDLARLEREDAELAVLAHRLLASNLSEKLAMANRMIQLAQR